MIDLTGAKVGDKLDTTQGQVITIKLISECKRLDFCGMFDDGSICTFGVDGRRDDGSVNHVVSKHDPRPWLKDLPDADLFTYDWLACDLDGAWYYYSDEPSLSSVNWRANSSANSQAGHLDCIKMPKLTGDQWKDSKISILALKAWQLTSQ